MTSRGLSLYLKRLGAAAATTLFCLMPLAASALTPEQQEQTKQIQERLLASPSAVETRPTLDPAQFTDPKIRSAYRAAKEIPGVLDKMFCYCYCEILPMYGEKEFHKSLLTCFINQHASKCYRCVQQAVDAMRLHRDGKKPAEIARIFAARYADKTTAKK